MRGPRDDQVLVDVRAQYPDGVRGSAVAVIERHGRYQFALKLYKVHSRSRSRLRVVCEPEFIPSMHCSPSHHADDIGARFAVPPGLRVPIRTTGVPK